MKRKLRVLFAIDKLNTARGGQRWLVDLVTRLRDQYDIEPLVVSQRTTEGPFGDELKAAGIEVHYHEDHVHSGESGFLEHAFKASKEIKNFHPDVVLTNMSPVDINYGIPATFKGIPTLSVIHNTDPVKYTGTWGHRLRIVWDQVTRLFGSRKHAVIHVASSGADLYEQHGYRSGMGVINNGVDTNRFYPRPDRAAMLRERYGIPQGARVMGIAAGFEHDDIKNYKGLIPAFKKIAQDNPNAYLLIAGNNTDSPELQQLIDDHPQIRVAGRLDNTAEDFFPAIDVNILPSHSEAFSYALLEGLASGKPAYSTNVGDSPLIVGDAGRIFPARDQQALEGALQEIATMPQSTLNTMSKRALARSKLFSIDAMVEKYAAKLWNLYYEHTSDVQKTLPFESLVSQWQSETPMSPETRPAAVGYDWDDSLCNSYSKGDPAIEAYELSLRKLEEIGYVPKQRLKYSDRREGEQAAELFKRMFDDPIAANLGYQLYIQKYIEVFPKYAELMEGTRDLIKYHIDNNIPFFVTSNSPQAIVQAQFDYFLSDLMPEGYNPVVLGSIQTDNGIAITRAKPNPDRILDAKRRLGLNPTDKVIFLGDTHDTDVLAAQVAGCHPVLLDRSRASIASDKYDTVTSLREFLGHMKSMFGFPSYPAPQRDKPTFCNLQL